ncbi:unnamed protein product [Ambrosiozyma monospora]|uniref:Unnamed protein product n=1 Tax=Ambrosiozyma monospora TaxID=43982 RepID=A0A9W6Z1V4_AMBMO|nr:unnamed protein product [Ambrosiozyma monospora]
MSQSMLSEVQPVSLLPPRRHRHRRSAAISGDFDVQGMGIFLPPQVNAAISASGSKSVPSSLSGSPVKNNFATLAGTPSKSSNASVKTPSTPNFLVTDEDTKRTVSPRGDDLESLNSPFKKPNADFVSTASSGPNSANSSTDRLSASAQSTTSSSQLRFFITEEAKFDKHSSIPNAVIDLDDILNKPLSSSSLNSFNINNNNNNNNTNVPSMSIPSVLRKAGLVADNSHYPRHSLYASPKKEVSIVEGIREEESEGEEIFETDIAALKNKSSHNSEVSSLNSLMLNNNKSLPGLSITDNCSTNSLTSTNSGGSAAKSLSNFNTGSMQSLRTKVRYQSYYNNQPSVLSPTLTSLNLNNTLPQHNSDDLAKPSKKILYPHSPSTSLLKPARQSKSRSPVRPMRFSGSSYTLKQTNPFQYESVAYDIPKNFHRDHDYLGNMSVSSTPSPCKSIADENDASTPTSATHSLSNSVMFNASNSSSVSLSRSRKSVGSSSLCHSISPSRHERAKSSVSQRNVLTVASINSSTNNNDTANDRHKRSSSLFSSFSSKLHHRKRSSIVSMCSHTSKRTSIIEKTTDELLGLDASSGTTPTLASYDESENGCGLRSPVLNDNTIVMDDATLTEDFVLGEPGPMIDPSTRGTTQNQFVNAKALSNISNSHSQYKSNKHNNNSNIKVKRSSLINRSSTKENDMCSKSNKKNSKVTFLEPPHVKGHSKKGSTSRLLSWISSKSSNTRKAEEI